MIDGDAIHSVSAGCEKGIVNIFLRGPLAVHAQHGSCSTGTMARGIHRNLCTKAFSQPAATL